MNIFERIRLAITRGGNGHLTSDPNAERLNFIGDDEALRRQRVAAYRCWYIGDSDELDNFYRNMDLTGFSRNPIYTANQRQYFHALSERERKVKCVHTGIGRAAITTMVNVVGVPRITCDAQERWDAIAERNSFASLLTQQIRPLTMVEGWGATKVIFDEDVADVPLITFYEAQDVDFMTRSGVVTGIVYRDYYEHAGKKYVMAETRRVEAGESLVEYSLYEYGKGNEATPVPLDAVPAISGTIPAAGGYRIPGLRFPLGQPVRYLFDPLDREHGGSFFAGKLDIMDDLDMLASIESLTEKNSSPVTYYPTDVLRRSKAGQPETPALFNRQFVKKPSVPDANGNEDGKIDVDAPNLDFSRYSTALVEKTKLFLNGWMAPATMGIGLSLKDNAEAQREKEKVTIMTRGNIIANETIALKALVNSCLVLDEFMRTGEITRTDYGVNVTYNEFANPSMETMLPVLGTAWVQGEISTERYVRAMYPDEDGESLAREAKWLDDNRMREASYGLDEDAAGEGGGGTLGDGGVATGDAGLGAGEDDGPAAARGDAGEAAEGTAR